METILDLLDQYGLLVYIILFLYCALKSGWLPLFASYAAYLGALQVELVAFSTFLGGYLGDEIRFYAAKTYGVSWMKRSGTLIRLFEKAKILVEKYGVTYIFIYRYPKGLRTIGALPMGLTDLSWKKFTLLNMSSAGLWVLIMVGGGYFFGKRFEVLGIENLTAISILLLCVFLIFLYRLYKSEHE
jgi:membrane protein DedA with SNARE-associated domain